MRRSVGKLSRLLVPTIQTHLFFARDPSPASGFCVPDTALVWIESADHPRFVELETFCVANGFSAGWAGGICRDGARAVLSVDVASGVLTGMAWVSTRRFFVDEIGAELALPDDAAYLFGGFVAPAFRGRRLHRMLVSARLHRLCEWGLRAVTICHEDNRASIRSNLDEGYHPILQYQRWRWGPLRGRRALPPYGNGPTDYDLLFESANVIRLVARSPHPGRVRPAA